MSSSEAAARCGRLELVASRGTITSKPLAQASGVVALDRMNDDRAGAPRGGEEALHRLEHLGRPGIEVGHAFDKEGVDHVYQDEGGPRHQPPSSPSRRRSAMPSATRTRMTTR